MGKYTGTLPSNLKVKKTSQQVIDDTIAWAKHIAADNNFHYGHGDAAHHNGCYFCDTQPSVKKSLKDYKKTYCCNPFVGAAWAHGGQDKQAIGLCSKGKSWGFQKKSGNGYYWGSDRFKNISVKSEKDLKPGDVLCRDTHVSLYIGNDKIVEAAIEDDNKKGSTKWKNSIRVRKLSTKYSGKGIKGYQRFHRYIKSVNRTINISIGELSERVGQWQDFLNWWSNGEFYIQCGGRDNFFGDNTKEWTKKFQKKEIGNATGIVDKTTLATAKKIEK